MSDKRPEYADLTRDHPRALSQTILDLKMAALSLIAEPRDCTRCGSRRATRIRKKGDGPIEVLCRDCREAIEFEDLIAEQRARADRMRPRRSS